MKLAPDRLPNAPAEKSISITITTVSRVSGMLRTIMLINTDTIVIRLWKNCGIACDSICLSVSMSLV